MVRRRFSCGFVRTSAVAFAVIALAASACALAPVLVRADCPPGRLFGAHAPYPVGSGPRELVLGDFNADGILDLATASGTTTFGAPGKGTVSVRLGRGAGGVGDGSFDPPVNYAAGTRLTDLVTGDFDEDGITDLAAADFDGLQVVVLFGKGDAGVGNGTFAAPVSFAFGTQPHCLATGDFNKDGITDLVIGDEASLQHAYVGVLLGLGSGGVGNGDFAAPQFFHAGATMLSLVVGDYDEDGISDLAVTTWQPMGVAVLKGGGSGGVGDGTFLPPVVLGQGIQPYAIVQGDFDENGIVDLATANHAPSGANDGGSIWVMRGRGTGGVGDGTFDPAVSYAASNHANGIVAGDWNTDGIADLAVANEIADSITVLLGQGFAGTGNGTFAQPSSYHAGAYPLRLATADVNEDGRDDLLAAEFFASDARVYLGGCAPHTGVGPRIAAVRDVPGDQGGAVFLAWERSPHDGPWGTFVRQYRVSRRTSPAAAWEDLATLPAQRLEGYGYTAATTQDSMPGDNPTTAFRVTALTADAESYFESTVDSGYSVDNLPPPPPETFEATLAGGVALRWDAGPVSDAASYRLYRGATPDFAISEATLVTELTQTAYFDPLGTASSAYKLVSVDLHGNASDPVLAIPVPPAVDLTLSLERRGTNPARDGRIAVSFTLPTASPGVLELFDARGRLVCARAVSGIGEGSAVLPGEHSGLASGVYVLRLTHAGRSVRTKSVVLR